MEILRVENSQKRGVYFVANALAHEASRYPYNKDRRSHEQWHPMPYEDSILREWWEHREAKKEWYFGFKDMKHLLDWFPKHKWKNFVEYNKEDSERNPLGIGTYEIDEQFVRIGDRQICFQRNVGKRTKFEEFRHRNVIEKISSAMFTSNV
jgi:hypothetical protein